MAVNPRKLPRLGVRQPRFEVKFAWYDMWVGAFYDRAQRTLYVCPLPMLLLVVRFGRGMAVNEPRTHVPAFEPGDFITNREEIWQALVVNQPHHFIERPNGGRTYYTTNADLFDALHRFFDEKEAVSR